jgi:hypothetical protein
MNARTCFVTVYFFKCVKHNDSHENIFFNFHFDGVNYLSIANAHIKLVLRCIINIPTHYEILSISQHFKHGDHMNLSNVMRNI